MRTVPFAAAAAAVALAICACAAAAVPRERPAEHAHDALENGRAWPHTFRPYASGSFWNKRLPDTTRLRLLPGSDAIVRVAEEGSPGRVVRVVPWGSGWDEGHPIVFAARTDPLVSPRCTRYCDTAHPLRPFHIPARARAGDGSDHHLAVVQPDGTEIDLWAIDQPGLGRDWRSGDVISFGSGMVCGNFFSGPGSGKEMATVGGACLGAGLIRAAELRAGAIRHALFTNVDCGAHAFVYPATQPIDEVCSGSGPHVPNGAHLWLDLSDREIESLAVRPWEKTILRALHDYGAYVEDTIGGGERAHGLFAPWFEDDAQYAPFGRPNPLLAWAQEQGWTPIRLRPKTEAYRATTLYQYTETWKPVDWAAHLHVLDPCYARGSC